MMKILALDIGNVCVKINFSNFAKALKLPEIPEVLLDMQRDLECGRISDEAFIYAICQVAKVDPETALAAFNTILVEVVPGMNEVISSLAQYGVEARFFSDISQTHLIRTLQMFPAASNVPDGMYSFVSGAQKPAEAMFAAFENRFGPPALYVDDRAELITAARKRNWNALLFSTAEELKKAVAAL